MHQFAFVAAFASLCLAAACDRPVPAPGPEVAAPEVAAPAVTDTAAALGLPTDPDSLADGRSIAADNCASCHGLDQDDSQRPDAPPLRRVLSLHDPESLAEDFRNGIHVGHEDMPEFVFGDLGMDMLLSYLISIQEAPPAE